MSKIVLLHNLNRNIQFKIKLCTITMHTLFGISLVLYMLKLSVGQGLSYYLGDKTEFNVSGKVSSPGISGVIPDEGSSLETSNSVLSPW